MAASLRTYGDPNARDPASHAAAVTPSDTVDLAVVTTALWVGNTGVSGVSGNLAVIMEDGQTVTFTGALTGTYLPIRVSRVMATGTTATNILALWR